MYKKIISVVIPTKNEEKTIGNVLDDLNDLKKELNNYLFEILIIDANSVDKTVQFASAHVLQPKIFFQDKTGKGEAIKIGFIKAIGDFIIMIDSDGSNSVKEITPMIEILDNLDSKIDLVKGSRNLHGGGSEDITYLRSAGNNFLTKVANLLYQQKWTDLAYGYMCFKKESLPYLDLESNFNSKFFRILFSKTSYGDGFEIETILLCKAAKNRLNIKEFPSFELKRVYGSSNLNSVRDGTRALFAMIYEKIKE